MYWTFLANECLFHYSFILIHPQGVMGFWEGERRGKQNIAIHRGLWSPKKTKPFIMDLVCTPQGILYALYKGRSAALCPFLYMRKLHGEFWNVCITTGRIQSHGEIICWNKCIWGWGACKILASWWLRQKNNFSSLKKIEFWDWGRFLL